MFRDECLSMWKGDLFMMGIFLMLCIWKKNSPMKQPESTFHSEEVFDFCIQIFFILDKGTITH